MNDQQNEVTTQERRLNRRINPLAIGAWGCLFVAFLMILFAATIARSETINCPTPQLERQAKRLEKLTNRTTNRSAKKLERQAKRDLQDQLENAPAINQRGFVDPDRRIEGGESLVVRERNSTKVFDGCSVFARVEEIGAFKNCGIISEPGTYKEVCDFRFYHLVEENGQTTTMDVEPLQNKWSLYKTYEEGGWAVIVETSAFGILTFSETGEFEADARLEVHAAASNFDFKDQGERSGTIEDYEERTSMPLP